MDRGRHRAVLSAAAAGGGLLLALANGFGAPGTPAPAAPTVAPASTPAPAAASTATPWVQAAPPPTASSAKPPPIIIRLDKEGRYYFDKEKEPLSTDALLDRVRKSGDLQGSSLRAIIRAEPGASYAAITAALERLRDAGITNVTFNQLTPGKASAPGPAPSPEVAPAAPPSREDTARAMARKREAELAGQPPPTAPPSPVKPPRGEPPLSSEDREAYQRNLGLWLAMPPEEKKAIRGLANERIQEEIEKAYQTSGLSLNDDQREVFALRYRQERRRLERDLQEKAKAERARRLPEIMERLKHEFPAVAPANSPRPPPKPAATPSPVSTVATLPSPAR